ncbi:unnamed protein product [Cyclocybe aegerita]|uniref:Endonuclease/exonuclease/phosphatase domain-containing protein n=1 Tax=Cyclocybe aegerita TaxID=1973307 RepID=A0A8S0W4N0_CYCAE|nr:unnamed protein product [Cyclocybe aegerita]
MKESNISREKTLKMPLNMSDTPQQHQQMRIWQQNLNKSLHAQLDLLHSADPNDFDILLLQEPHIDHLGNTRANAHWAVIYPDRHLRDPKKTRSVILINKKVSTTSWTPIATQSSDIMAIQLQGDFGTVRIFNIYNDCQNDDSLNMLANHLRTQEHREHPVAPMRMVWAGDFNRHHPLWDEERNNHLFTTPSNDDGTSERHTNPRGINNEEYYKS